MISSNNFSKSVSGINLAVHKKNDEDDQCPTAKSETREAIFVFLASCTVGALFFIAIYGWRILDGTYVDWILNAGGDLAQSYYGWCFFRSSDWHFPIGLMDGIAYPALTSIIYIDSVPLFNIIFKVLSPLLPETFQFFGVWGICCLALNGGIGALVVRALSKDAISAVLASPIFVLTTFSIQRLYTHTALAASWLILLAILIVVNERKRKIEGKDCLKWAGLFALGVGINIYYLPILAIIMLINCIYHGLIARKWAMPFLVLVSSLVGTFACFWLLGGLYHLGSTGLDALNTGALSANLNSLFNPMETLLYLTGFSAFLPSRPLAFSGQYEGYGYLGLGGILLCLLAVAGIVICRRNKVLERKEFVLVVVAFVLLVIASMGVVATFDDKVLFEIPYPEIFDKIWSTFRSNGRFIWGAWCILMVSAIVVVLARYPQTVGRILVAACMVLQVADLSTMLGNRHAIYSHRQATYTASCSVEGVESLLEGKRHIQIMDPNRMLKLSLYYDLGEAALRGSSTMNDFYYSRRDTASIVSYDKEQQEVLEAGEPDRETLYVFSSVAEAAQYQDVLELYYLDGLIFGRTDRCGSIANVLHISDITAVDVESVGAAVESFGCRQDTAIGVDATLRAGADSVSFAEFEFMRPNDDGGQHAIGLVYAGEVGSDQLAKLQQVSDATFWQLVIA